MLLTLIAAVKRYLKYRDTMYELSRLTARDLQDLGINRSEIEFIAKNSAGFGK